MSKVEAVITGAIMGFLLAFLFMLLAGVYVTYGSWPEEWWPAYRGFHVVFGAFGAFIGGFLTAEFWSE